MSPVNQRFLRAWLGCFFMLLWEVSQATSRPASTRPSRASLGNFAATSSALGFPWHFSSSALLCCWSRFTIFHGSSLMLSLLTTLMTVLFGLCYLVSRHHLSFWGPTSGTSKMLLSFLWTTSAKALWDSWPALVLDHFAQYLHSCQWSFARWELATCRALLHMGFFVERTSTTTPSAFCSWYYCIFIVTCAEIAIMLCYFQVRRDNRHCWWRSFCTGGSTALYFFRYFDCLF